MWLWGTTRPVRGYAGRLHLVERQVPVILSALCGVLVDEVWDNRPPQHGRLVCPECCVAAIEVLMPPVQWPV